MVTSFALQMVEAMGCVICLNTIVCRAGERAIQLLMCSGYAPWLERLKVVFTNSQCYELDSLPGYSGRSSSKASKALCLLSYLKPTCTPTSLAKQGHWLCSADYLLCLPISQLVFLGYIASRCSCQPFLSAGAGGHVLKWVG